MLAYFQEMEANRTGYKMNVHFAANQKASSEERKASFTKQSFFFAFFFFKEVKRDLKEPHS